MDSDAQSGDSFYAARRSYFTSSRLDTSPCSPSSISGSTLSSPLESELGSTESESDLDGEYVAELSRQMAFFMFQDDDDDAATDELGRDCNDPFSWLRQRDGKLKGLKVDGDKNMCRSRGSSESSSPLSPSSILSNSRSSVRGTDTGLLSEQDQIEYRIRNAKLAYAQNQKGRKKKNGSHRKGNRQMELNKQIRRVELEKKATKELEQQIKQRYDSKKPVLSGESSSRTTVGTGVFIPRQRGYDHEATEKSGRPSVVIPARVIQALRLNFNKVGTSCLPSAAVSLIQNDWIAGDVICGLEHGEDVGNTANPVRSPERLLPQEWTY